jgi:hypothetical protein
MYPTEVLGQLWNDLPVRMRRRQASSSTERCLVLDLVDVAVQKGAPLEEAARCCGVTVTLLQTWRRQRLESMERLDLLRISLADWARRQESRR